MSIFDEIKTDAADALYQICVELGITLTLQLSGGSPLTVYAMPDNQTTRNLITGGASGDALTLISFTVPLQTNFNATTALSASNALVTYESIQYRVMECTVDPSRAVYTITCEAYAG